MLLCIVETLQYTILAHLSLLSSYTRNCRVIRLQSFFAVLSILYLLYSFGKQTAPQQDDLDVNTIKENQHSIFVTLFFLYFPVGRASTSESQKKFHGSQILLVSFTVMCEVESLREIL